MSKKSKDFYQSPQKSFQITTQISAGHKPYRSNPADHSYFKVFSVLQLQKHKLQIQNPQNKIRHLHTRLHHLEFVFNRILAVNICLP